MLDILSMMLLFYAIGVQLAAILMELSPRKEEYMDKGFLVLLSWLAVMAIMVYENAEDNPNDDEEDW